MSKLCNVKHIPRRERKESEITRDHLGSFVAEGSRAWNFISGFTHGRPMIRESLIHLANVFSAISGVSFGRDFRRRVDLIYKWFDDHIEEFEPFRCIIEVDVVETEQSNPSASSK
jgi:hypothetical protein